MIIEINIEELTPIVQKAVSEAIAPLLQIYDRKISASEAVEVLGFKSRKGLMNMVRRGELTAHTNGNSHPKFLLSEVIRAKNEHLRSTGRHK